MSRRLSHISLTLGKELRETLRDRRTLAMMVLFPLVVYPLLSLLVTQLVFTREKAREQKPARVAVVGDDADAVDLRARVQKLPRLFSLAAGGTRADVESGRLDALLLFPARTGGDIRQVEIVFDAARDDSREAEDRLSDVVARALPAGCSRFDVKKDDIASGAKLGGYLLSKALPLALVLMVLLGAFYPAIDVTAGERERGTLETVLASPIARFDLLLGKVLAVTLIAALTGLLNLASMTITLVQTMRLADAAALPVPWSRAAASTLVLVPAAFLFGALFVAIGSLARGFKEAQNFLMPAYFIGIAPALVGAVGERALTNGAALVPAMNVTLLARELLLGKAHPMTTLLVLASTFLYGCLALAFAARVYDSERFIDPAAARATPSARSTSDEPSAGLALLAFSLAFLLLVFIFVPWQKHNLVRGLLASQWLGMLGLVAVLARVTGRKLGPMIALHPPAPSAALGAALIGASAWAAVALLSEWLVPVPKEVVEQLRRALVPPDHSRGLAANLFLVALTPAVCEEALFRGVVLRGLATRLAPSAAIAVTGLLFGLFHLDLYRLLPTTALGLLLSWLALRSGSLVPSMIAHFLNNAVLITLATYGVDQRLGTLSRPTAAALFFAALSVTAGGIWLVRRSGRA